MKSVEGKHILVTGAAGFIGSHLTRRLVADGATVTVVLRPETRRWRIADDIRQPDIQVLELTDSAALARCLGNRPPDIVFHLAGESGGRANFDRADVSRNFATNVLGSFQLLDAIRLTAPSARVVRFGSMAEYGDNPVPFDESIREHPSSAYAASLVASAYLAHGAARNWGIALTTLRLSLVYGPGQDASFFVPGLMLAALAGERFAMTSGEQSCDYVYVEDVVDASLAAAATDEASGRIINIGSGGETIIGELAQQIVSIAGVENILEMGQLAQRTGEASRRFMDISRARRVLGWEPGTLLEQGLSCTLDWYRENAALAAEYRRDNR